jgi:hypothetical protein
MFVVSSRTFLGETGIVLNGEGEFNNYRYHVVALF